MLRWNEAQMEAFRALQKGSASIPVKLEEWAKYRNKKTTVDGKKFDSKLEARRYVELKRLEAAKVISGLRCQVPYALEVNGNLICRYVADCRCTGRSPGTTRTCCRTRSTSSKSTSQKGAGRSS